MSDAVRWVSGPPGWSTASRISRARSSSSAKWLFCVRMRRRSDTLARRASSGVAARSSRSRSISPCSASIVRSASSGIVLAMRKGAMPSAWNVWPRIARSSAISIEARSSRGSVCSSASSDVPRARAIARSSVSLGSRRPFSIIDSWLGARSTAEASASSVMP